MLFLSKEFFNALAGWILSNEGLVQRYGSRGAPGAADAFSRDPR